MTMLKGIKTGIWSYVSEDRDVDDLIFGTECNQESADTCSDR